MELWKQVMDTYYEISTYGRLRNSKTKKVLKTYTQKGSYESYRTIRYNTCFMIHRLVAIAFIPNPENKREVNHKDGDTSNNHVDNLEWTTKEENIQHGIQIGKVCHRKGVKQMLNGVTINTFPSLFTASTSTGICKKAISKCCNGKPHYHTAGGYEWSFVTNAPKDT